jgi:hypothetical protein
MIHSRDPGFLARPSRNDPPAAAAGSGKRILYLLGLDHERLSYYHNGIERRLTDLHGLVLRDVLA